MKRKTYSPEIIDLSARYPFLKESGIAVEFFPFINNKKEYLHFHNLVEIVYIVSGTGIHIVGEKEYQVESGSLAIINYEQAHTMITDKMSIYNIYLQPERVPHLFLPPDLQVLFDKYFPSYSGLQYELNNVHHFQFPKDKNPEDLLIRMKMETDLQRFESIAALRNLYQLFILDCLQTIKERPAKKIRLKLADVRIERVRTYMEDNLQENLSPQKLSEKFGFNKEHLCRRFKEYTGKTICHYANYSRIQTLLPVLLDQEQSISEIAFKNGFNDLSHFNRNFRKIIGLTPSNYIRTYKK